MAAPGLRGGCSCIFAYMLASRALFSGRTRERLLTKIMMLHECRPAEHSIPALPAVLRSVLADPARASLARLMPNINDQHPHALELLCGLLQFNGADRLTAEQALAHPYFTTADWARVASTSTATTLQPHDLCDAVVPEFVDTQLSTAI
jgi:negative regulator of the PHO system